jgi:hypothetical protein
MEAINPLGALERHEKYQTVFVDKMAGLHASVHALAQNMMEERHLQEEARPLKELAMNGHRDAEAVLKKAVKLVASKASPTTRGRLEGVAERRAQIVAECVEQAHCFGAVDARWSAMLARRSAIRQAGALIQRELDVMPCFLDALHDRVTMPPLSLPSDTLDADTMVQFDPVFAIKESATTTVLGRATEYQAALYEIQKQSSEEIKARKALAICNGRLEVLGARLKEIKAEIATLDDHTGRRVARRTGQRQATVLIDLHGLKAELVGGLEEIRGLKRLEEAAEAKEKAATIAKDKAIKCFSASGTLLASVVEESLS